MPLNITGALAPVHKRETVVCARDFSFLTKKKNKERVAGRERDGWMGYGVCIATKKAYYTVCGSSLDENMFEDWSKLFKQGS
jgi:uncharacterized protein YifE (UPF0438 family)